MRDQASCNQLVEVIGFRMQEMADLLRRDLAQTALTMLIKPAVWKNDAGLVVGSVSVSTVEDAAEDSIDGVLTARISDHDITVESDVCLSDGTLISELLEETTHAKTTEDFIGIIEEAVRKVTPLMVSIMVSVARQQSLTDDHGTTT